MNEPAPIAELMSEHARALGALDALNDVVDSVRTGAPSWEQTAEGVAGGLHRLLETLRLHFRKEEEVLFPDLLQMVAEGSEEAGILAGFLAGQSDEDLTAHTAVRLRMQELLALFPGAEAAGGGAPTAVHDGLVFTRELLRRHQQKEERIIFPLIERLLGPRQMAEVGRRMASVSALA